MRIIALYLRGQRVVLEDSGAILSKANQALATLERYKLRLDEVTGTLSALEIEDLVTVRDVAAVAQRLEMVRRIADEVAGYVVAARRGRPAAVAAAGRADRRRRPGPRPGRPRLPARAHRQAGPHRRRRLRRPRRPGPHRAAGPDCRSPGPWASPAAWRSLESAVVPRGYRLLAKVPRLPGAVIDRLVEHFGGLQKLLAASIDDLQRVEGVGETRARSVREGLSRLAESSILERYV